MKLFRSALLLAACVFFTLSNPHVSLTYAENARIPSFGKTIASTASDEDFNPLATLSGVFASSGGTQDARPAETEEAGTEGGEAAPYDAEIRVARDMVYKAFRQEAEKYPDLMPEPYVDVRNTRVIRIAEHPVNVQNKDTPVEELEDVEYIIEFMILSNYYGDTLPQNVNIYDSVAVYRNGKMEVCQRSPLSLVRSAYYMTDYSGVIEEIIDLDGAYDGVVRPD